MLLRIAAAAVAATAAASGAAAFPGHTVRGTGECVYPGTCTPPAAAKFARVSPVTPRQQWNIAGGFCGSLSIQTGALAHGAWISQDLVRKANTFGAGHCDGGQPGRPGEDDSGCEVGAKNIGATAAGLKLKFSEWDYNSTKPQSPGYKKWMKQNLARGAVIVWLVMCKGDDVCPYEGACPNGGSFGHVSAAFLPVQHCQRGERAGGWVGGDQGSLFFSSALLPVPYTTRVPSTPVWVDAAVPDAATSAG
eukprot:SAG22_NODE_134_length_18372_cov_33.054944_6_plen_249_part_00